MHKCNTARAVAFQAFLAIPFVFELRQLLDFACTPTTLQLWDWFKLEDVSSEGRLVEGRVLVVVWGLVRGEGLALGFWGMWWSCLYIWDSFKLEA